ncbi:hypothetical protein [Actinomyces sp.]|uniref:hypothetical protein n=1 Tax=Actinomyces sp. TaxID=29317 RepID=UPI0026DD1981|nr:hypothetical protein [Actinomyces sp.]MDO4901736.1 hypothetical protein [Actinomyces sp.]
MTEQFRFDYDMAIAIAGKFATAQDDLEVNEPTVPYSVDAGDGSTYIASMIAQLATDAGTLALAAELGNTNMKNAIDLVTGADHDVAQTFRDMEEKMP